MWRADSAIPSRLGYLPDSRESDGSLRACNKAVDRLCSAVINAVVDSAQSGKQSSDYFQSQGDSDN